MPDRREEVARVIEPRLTNEQWLSSYGDEWGAELLAVALAKADAILSLVEGWGEEDQGSSRSAQPRVRPDGLPASETQHSAGEERPVWAVLEIYMSRLLKTWAIEERGQRYRPPTDAERDAIRSFISDVSCCLADDFWPEDATLPLAAAYPAEFSVNSPSDEGASAGNPVEDEQKGWEPFVPEFTDFREFVVYRPDAGVFTARWGYPLAEDGVPDFDADPVLFTSGGEDLTGDYPTHQRPLPPPPQAKTS